MTTITRTVTITSIACCSCGLIFGLEEAFKKERLEDKRQWSCPNGCKQHFTGRNTNEELAIAQRDNEALRVQRQQLEHAVMDEAAKASRLRAKNKRLTARADAGVCTKCNRSFANVRRHMNTKHPKK